MKIVADSGVVELSQSELIETNGGEAGDFAEWLGYVAGVVVQVVVESFEGIAEANKNCPTLDK